MGGKSTLIDSFALADTKKGKISVSHLDEPYGTGSFPVVSIGISLKGDENSPDWKAHIPYENLDQLIETLQKAKESFESKEK
ncbi:MAG TPA: hypothetical protein CFH79_00880 [Sulfurospirillum sp. UBA11407]|nr:MAG TPA: hypothetical protein CFH79_00880 [Sulfurospirillum sp. UBA11407]